jgi:hypothetical protein
MVTMPPPLGWRREDLLAAYAALAKRSQQFREIRDELTPEQWVRINETLDVESTESAARLAGVSETVVAAVAQVRACMQKWNHDLAKVVDCTDGKIDP